jgi:uncharacterized protein (DUF952 family)
MSRLILHITARSEWEAAGAAGRYAAPSLVTEGFIHLSAPEQVVRVANARYAGASDLMLLCVAADRLEAPLRDEISDAGEETFPHLYGVLNLDAVVAVVPFAEGVDGFALPAEITRLARRAEVGEQLAG